MVTALACDSLDRWPVQLPTEPLSGNDLGQVVHTRASVTKHYNLVPVAGQRCPATGKVTVGLASHWPCVTAVYPPIGARPSKGDEHPINTLHGVWYSLPAQYERGA